MKVTAQKNSSAAAPGASHTPAATYEPNSGRHHIRIKMPIDVVVDGVTYQAADWSLGGIKIADIETGRATGDTFVAELSVPFQGFRFSLPVTCEVVYNDPERRFVGCKFIDLADDQVALLRYLVDAFVSGRVASVDALFHVVAGGARGRLKKSIDPLAVPLRQRVAHAARRTVQVGLLLAVGAVFLAVAVGAVHTRLFTVEATIAAVSAPTFDMRAPAAGSLLGPGLRPGESVAAGGVLFEVRNAALDGELEVTRATLRREQAALAGLRQKLAERETFFAEYRVLAAAAVEKAEAEHERAAKRDEIAQRLARRAAARRDLSAATARAADLALIAEAKAAFDLRAAVAALSEAHSNDRMARESYFYTGTRVEGGEPADIERHIAEAEKGVATAEARVSALMARTRAMVATSPCDCFVHAVLAKPGEWLGPGRLVYVLRSADGSRTLIEALVGQERADELEIGGHADVKLADRDGFIGAKVVSINRGRSYEPRAGLPEGARRAAESAVVLLALEMPLDGVEIGLPAKVRLSSNRRSVLMGFFGRAFASAVVD